MTEYDKYMDYFGLNEENKNDYRGVIGLVKDAEGNINLIKDTNMYSMPTCVEKKRDASIFPEI